MLGHAVSAGGHVVGLLAGASSAGRSLAGTDLGTDHTHRVEDGERQIDRAPLAALVQHQPRQRRATAVQGRDQPESPVILVGSQHLPAPILLVEVTPDPIPTAELGGEQTRALVQIDHGGALVGRIPHHMPDRLGRLAGGGRVGAIVGEEVDRAAVVHFRPAVRLAGHPSADLSRRTR